MRHVIGFIFVVSLFLAGCPRPLPVPREPPDTHLCPAACAKLDKLGCEEAEPIEMRDGSMVTCTEFCVDLQQKGHWLNPTCVSEISSCEGMDQCMKNEE